ncbi:hypothetical protein K431DRAFT_108403 [Polychaeton citri CBS 116435]|uniref:Uncharacterized protein n=1 Tax=Polychaeton citri CBS 116435 TaxID=1314669 RepID=A0A9P4UP24_9PEZI|nr:hypothetical protein K431DRAFT_108403 [Polychaeton citri CBS 116435]
MRAIAHPPIRTSPAIDSPRLPTSALICLSPVPATPLFRLLHIRSLLDGASPYRVKRGLESPGRIPSYTQHNASLQMQRNHAVDYTTSDLRLRVVGRVNTFSGPPSPSVLVMSPPRRRRHMAWCFLPTVYISSVEA